MCHYFNSLFRNDWGFVLQLKNIFNLHVVKFLVYSFMSFDQCNDHVTSVSIQMQYCFITTPNFLLVSLDSDLHRSTFINDPFSISIGFALKGLDFKTAALIIRSVFFCGEGDWKTLVTRVDTKWIDDVLAAYVASMLIMIMVNRD